MLKIQIKRNGVFILFLLIFLVILSSVYVNVYAEEANVSETEEISVYEINSDQYRGFISIPSEEYLIENHIDRYGLSVTYANDRKWTSRRYEKNDEIEFDVSEDFIARIGNLSVDTEFLESIDNRLKNILESNGIYEDIKYRCIIDRQHYSQTDIPVTIWIATEREKYFVTINESELFSENNSNENIYKLYTYTQYKNKFGMCDGILSINGQDCAKENYVKFEYNEIYLPLRTIVEQLGGTIEWKAEENSAVISKAGAMYVLRMTNYPVLVEAQNADISTIIPPGGHREFCEIINGRIIIGSELAEKIAGIMGADISVSFEEHKVYIKSLPVN